MGAPAQLLGRIAARVKARAVLLIPKDKTPPLIWRADDESTGIRELPAEPARVSPH